jgi:hypothetical protein
VELDRENSDVPGGHGRIEPARSDQAGGLYV